MRQDVAQLCQRLDYRFANAELLDRALTHRSASNLNNERLEFLGDAVLNLVISTELYARFEEEDEGRLSRLRAALVKGETLADLANELNLGDYVRLGSGELKSGGFRRRSILADTLEAIFGAIYLDSNLETIRNIILRLFGERITTIGSTSNLKDPKTRLQEYLQGQRRALPSYEVSDIEGEPHAQTFTVRCIVDGIEMAFIATGSSRRKAEQAAATQALDYLETQT